MKPFYLCAFLLVSLRIGQACFEHWADARSRDRSLPLNGALCDIPFSLGQWLGRSVDLDQTVLKSAAADQFIRRDYSNAAGDSVALYVTYYGGLRHNVPHGPGVCYPMSGWKMLENRLLTTPHGDCRLFVFEKETDRQLVLYWHYINGVRMADARRTRLAIASQILTGTRGSIVQVQLGVSATGRDTDDALQSATAFLMHLDPVLNRLLPREGDTAEGTAK